MLLQSLRNKVTLDDDNTACVSFVGNTMTFLEGLNLEVPTSSAILILQLKRIESRENAFCMSSSFKMVSVGHVRVKVAELLQTDNMNLKELIKIKGKH